MPKRKRSIMGNRNKYNQRQREIGRKGTEYEIGERRLVDTVSHAQQTKNDVCS